MSVQVVKLERPNPRQEEFLKCEKKYVAFGGARGGGKSWAVRTKAVLMALKYPGIRILLVRRTMPELESNHLRFLRRQLAGGGGIQGGLPAAGVPRRQCAGTGVLRL